MVHFREAFPTLTVEDVTLAHDIKTLTELDLQRDCAEQARLYCESYARRREPLRMYPYPCGQVLGCCCHTVDAQEFYAVEELRLTALVDEEKKVAMARPLGMAFVTLGVFERNQRSISFSPSSDLLTSSRFRHSWRCSNDEAPTTSLPGHKMVRELFPGSVGHLLGKFKHR